MDQHKEVRDAYRERHLKLSYYLIALTVASLGFTINHTANQIMALHQIPMALGIVFWGISIYYGLKHLDVDLDILWRQHGIFYAREEMPKYGKSQQEVNQVVHDKLKELGFFELNHDSLPDIIAYSEKKNWIYLIEAFYTSGLMSEERIFELKKSLIDCKADLIFITAFISKNVFKKNISDIGWETEVWTADNPDHLVHFNGGKFLGPYSPKSST